jgi:predicted nucleic acid-binding Zn ribbon protein
MVCPACSKEIPDGSVFCNLCGKPTEQNSRRRSAKLWLIFLFGFATAGAIAGGAYIYSEARRTKGPTKKPAAFAEMPLTVTVPLFAPITQTLVSGQLIVPAASDVRYKLQIDHKWMLNPVVSGSFRASGGTGNDIQVVLADEHSFENWINGDSAILYSTGKVTKGELNVPITQSGTYIFCFNNRSSRFSKKQVIANVVLTYFVEAGQSP